jgi:thiamine phosphate synthase YjbQ (UPF0047 family)
MTHRLFKKCIDLLVNEQSTKIIFNTLEGNYALCLLGKYAFVCIMAKQDYGVSRDFLKFLMKIHPSKKNFKIGTFEKMMSCQNPGNSLL